MLRDFRPRPVRTATQAAMDAVRSGARFRGMTGRVEPDDPMLSTEKPYNLFPTIAYSAHCLLCGDLAKYETLDYETAHNQARGHQRFQAVVKKDLRHETRVKRRSIAGER